MQIRKSRVRPRENVPEIVGEHLTSLKSDTVSRNLRRQDSSKILPVLSPVLCQESPMAIEHTRSLRGLLVAALALVSASAVAGEITLFQNRDFRGTAVTLQSP